MPERFDEVLTSARKRPPGSAGILPARDRPGPAGCRRSQEQPVQTLTELRQASASAGCPSASPHLTSRLLEIYATLARAYGPQHWWPGAGGFEMVAGAILTQNTAWPNVERALGNLRRAGALDPAALLALPEGELARLLRPAGCFNAKARTLRGFAQMLTDEFSGSLARLLDLPLDQLRSRLLTARGIGPETADDIVLYAAGHASFVIDAYTRRIFRRLEVTPSSDAYDDWRRLFMDALAADATMFNEYHALIVRHAKCSCRTRPRCETCILLPLCPTGATLSDARDRVSGNAADA